MTRRASSQGLAADRPGYSVAERARRLLCDEIWNIGVVDQPVADIAARGIRTAPRWLSATPRGAMLADPAFQEHADGGCTLYAEQLDRRRRIGEVWSAELPPGVDLATARFRPLLVEPHHMSYPFPVRNLDGQALLTAETWQAGRCSLWDRHHAVAATILEGRKVIDPTLWRGEDRWWLFCTLHDVSADGALFLFHAADLNGPWQAHVDNPVKVGRNGSRPAGPLFRANGRLIRPGQDCSRTYGGAVILHEILQLRPGMFSERPLRRIDPPPGRYAAGLHTICPAGEATLIDGKRWQASLPAAPARLIRKALRRAQRRPAGFR